MADVIPDAFSQVVLSVRFRRRLEAKETGTPSKIERILDYQGQLVRSMLISTADRRYGRDGFVAYLQGNWISSIFVMPENISRVHPFVAASLLRPGREDLIYEFDGGIKAGLIRDSGRTSPELRSGDDDSPAHFVIAGAGGEGHSAFHAVEKTTPRAASCTEAITVRIPNREKFCKLVRFYHDLLPKNKRIKTWLASLRFAPTENHLFIN